MHCKSKNVPRVIPLPPHSKAGSAQTSLQKLTMREPAVRWKMAPERGVMVFLKGELYYIMKNMIWENCYSLTIIGDSFSSNTLLRICTHMMKKYPMMTKWINGGALPNTGSHLGAYAIHMLTMAINWKRNWVILGPLNSSLSFPHQLKEFDGIPRLLEFSKICHACLSWRTNVLPFGQSRFRLHNPIVSPYKFLISRTCQLTPLDCHIINKWDYTMGLRNKFRIEHCEFSSVWEIPISYHYPPTHAYPLKK